VKSGFFTSNRIISGWPTRPVHTFTFKELSGTIIARTMTLATTRLQLHACTYTLAPTSSSVLPKERLLSDSRLRFCGLRSSSGLRLAVPD
jgi:hypothetical protein